MQELLRQQPSVAPQMAPPKAAAAAAMTAMRMTAVVTDPIPAGGTAEGDDGRVSPGHASPALMLPQDAAAGSAGTGRAAPVGIARRTTDTDPNPGQDPRGTACVHIPRSGLTSTSGMHMAQAGGMNPRMAIDTYMRPSGSVFACAARQVTPEST